MNRKRSQSESRDRWRRLLPAGCLAALAMAGTAALADEPLRIRVAEYAPYAFRADDGSWTGLEADAMLALAEEAGFEIEIVELPWTRALEAMRRGSVDLMASLSRTPEREEYVLYLGVVRHEEMALVVREEDADLPIESLDDLAAQEGRIGIQRGYTYSPELDRRLEEDPEFARHFEFVVDSGLNPRKCQGGRIFGFFEDRLYALHLLRTNPDYRGLDLHGFALAERQPIYLGVSSHLDARRFAKLQKAFEALESSGRFEALRREWTDRLSRPRAGPGR